LSHLKSKSEFNLEAAKVLIDEHDNYAPSVHCSYYGCFQFIKSKLNQIGITYDKVSADIVNSRQEGVTTLNSHNYYIKLVAEQVGLKSDVFLKKSIRDKIKRLKTFREISDYQNTYVDFAQSKEALNLSNEIIGLINQKL